MEVTIIFGRLTINSSQPLIFVQTILQFAHNEYQHLQCETKRIENPHTQYCRIYNSTERRFFEVLFYFSSSCTNPILLRGR